MAVSMGQFNNNQKTRAAIKSVIDDDNAVGVIQIIKYSDGSFDLVSDGDISLGDECYAKDLIAMSVQQNLSDQCGEA